MAQDYPWCGHCGSRNHRTFDCVKSPNATYEPTQADLDSLKSTAPAQPIKEVAPVVVADPPFLPGTFKGCPDICTKTWLPAHESERAARDFHEKNSPSCDTVKSPWWCECGKWHTTSNAPSPGDGKKRSMEPLPAKPFRRKVRESAFQERTDQLPRREVEAAPTPPPQPKKKVATEAKAPLKSARERGDLF
jgi:hypothetical protein